VLGVALICHSCCRGVFEFCRGLLGVNLSPGTVHNIMRDAALKARPYNLGQNLAQVDIGWKSLVVKSAFTPCPEW
jgi:hypothetical protein